MDNIVEFKLEGKYALFTDPVTKIGGEKSTYHFPTYQAIKGITESVYWKPTISWVIDKIRVMKKIQTESKNVKPLQMDGQYGTNRHDLSIYTYLRDVEYRVQAHFEWNMNRPDLAGDRNEDKHYQIALRMIEKGGRRDIFLGSRECQGYVGPCRFSSETGFYDGEAELSYGLMFHSFEYPSESGVEKLYARFWQAKITGGILSFPRPEACPHKREIRPMSMETVAVNTEEEID
ncbi:type I-C CRISPR-associated protein Cas5c [Treponema sp. TIM-1]|uniref:type I-C CRISPR-associated protein Cas5c n=1 Tax=Treponema sp. TIM-1 TaxID=2898417 RepID=UPI00397FCF63